MTPQQLDDTGWLALVDGVVYAPSEPTCNSKTLDTSLSAVRWRPVFLGLAGSRTAASQSPTGRSDSSLEATQEDAWLGN